jgi:hypothetical protein
VRPLQVTLVQRERAKNTAKLDNLLFLIYNRGDTVVGFAVMGQGLLELKHFELEEVGVISLFYFQLYLDKMFGIFECFQFVLFLFSRTTELASVHLLSKLHSKP